MILGVVAVLSLLLAAGAGGALYLSRKAPAQDPTATPSVVPPQQQTPTRGRLTVVTPERTERRLREAGWTIVPSSPTPAMNGFKGTYLTATRGTLSALVQLYEYESESIAIQTEKILRQTEGPAVERDGGRILYVFVTQDPGKSRALLEELVR